MVLQLGADRTPVYFIGIFMPSQSGFLGTPLRTCARTASGQVPGRLPLLHRDDKK